MQQIKVWSRIETFNQDRDPERLFLKYRTMQHDTFAFLRGTTHLFYEDWPKDSTLNDAPLAWINGDLHLENFGSYKGDNRLTYFDLNDFDQTVLAPCTWDLSRFICSLFVGGQTLGVETNQAIQLSLEFLDIYCRELTACKPRWIERSTATGMIRYLLKNLKKRSRADLLNERTINHHGSARLKIDGNKALLATIEEREKIISLLNNFAEQQKNQNFFQVLDVAKRVSGVGSLGLERYIVLVNGEGLDNHYLLDIKYQPGSCLTPYLPIDQPNWSSEAERVVTLQNRAQAVAPAFLSSVTDHSRSYLIKELMPQQDRLHLRHWNGKLPRLQKVVHSMAELIAWQHIRTGGWQGSAISDQWQAFGQETEWREAVLDHALTYSRQVRLDWLGFKEELGTHMPGLVD